MAGSNTLYIFIDESGNHSRGEYYVVSGCWCVSNYTTPEEVLDPTVQRLTEVANATAGEPLGHSELKGADLAPEILEAVVGALEKAYDDHTIPQSESPWEVSYPVRYSVTEFHPDAANAVIGDIFGSELEAPKALKAMALLSTLDPVFRSERLNAHTFDNIEVILDADVWQNPMQIVDEALDEVNSKPAGLNFSIQESEATPGIQMADIASYSWGRHLRKGDCPTAVKEIDKYRFADE